MDESDRINLNGSLRLCFDIVSVPVVEPSMMSTIKEKTHFTDQIFEINKLSRFLND